MEKITGNSLIESLIKVSYAFMVAGALMIGMMNVNVLNRSIPPGSALLKTSTGMGVIPVDSFVVVQQTNSLTVKGCRPKTPEGEKECKDILNLGGTLPFELPSSLGSGTIIGHNAEGTFILTAAHVCIDSIAPPGRPDPIIELDNPAYTLDVLYKSQTIIRDAAGNERPATFQAADLEHDICIMHTEEIWGLAVPIAKTEPAPGTMVQNMAAPLGIWAPGMVLRFEGYYSGIDTYQGNRYSIYAIPVAGGSSGSPVLYNGEIISIIVMSHRGFQSMGIGVRLEDIHTMIELID
jgi:hypothetical protein